jgi:hypothetical protein
MQPCRIRAGVLRQKPYVTTIIGARLRASGCRALTPVNEEN